MELLTELLDSHGSDSVAHPPVWPSEIADDHTPVEFSLAYSKSEPPTLRLLCEAFGSPPGVRTNMDAAQKFIGNQVGRRDLSLSRLESVQDLFATDYPHGPFALWCSLVFRSQRSPEFKVYFNPELKGVDTAPLLVSAALDRLGLGGSYQGMVDRAVRPGELGRSDRLTFFALDLHDGPDARVKLYLTHYDADVADMVRAAGLVDGVDTGLVADFCAAAGGTRRFAGRPLVGSYTLSVGADRPIGYSIYVPIRGYVNDDEEARDRVAGLLNRYGYDGAQLDRAIAAVTGRPLRAGAGLIAHVSLRLGPPRPGLSVYLSAEAYRVTPPRPRHQSATPTSV